MTLSRPQSIAGLVQNELDVLVIGGGIVGAGVARDAAMRGLRIGLVEQCDFAFGTSSRSSRLLHGGLRYLAQGRIGLVYEASREKRILHQIAPHLAAPLAFVFPSYRRSNWPLWQLGLGVKAYDLLCGGRNLGSSRKLSADETLALVPGLNPVDLTGAVRYFDALTNDARLVLDTLRSAERHGALLCNYLRFESAIREGDGWRGEVCDMLTGERHGIRTRSIVNAAGPWAASFPQSGVKLRLTKGVHLVVDRKRLPVDDAVVAADGTRILFAIPWGERMILGTTDTDYCGSLDDVRIDEGDVQYILAVIGRAFPEARLGASDVVSAWAGLRPLIAALGGGPSDISRAHQIREAQPGWFDVAGGKLTTYRLIAEQTVDRIAKHLRCKTSPCSTAEEPLPHDFSGILPPAVSREAVEHCCTSEWAVHLADVLVRRTSWHHYLDKRQEVANQVAEWMADMLGWDTVRKAEEIAQYHDRFAEGLRWQAGRRMTQGNRPPDPNTNRGEDGAVEQYG
jgi:glycerol-3-phosphate dehydrogenase